MGLATIIPRKMKIYMYAGELFFQSRGGVFERLRIPLTVLKAPSFVNAF